ncbi:MAG: hypothetical protein JXX29_05885 [Deltaproteobacteria bacterium]|nr:hypothetical protein [Deltaproteobacteria bacterium]MBN2671179.1 hypothetical protein [Deltaproteobacteria bacterium]
MTDSKTAKKTPLTRIEIGIIAGILLLSAIVYFPLHSQDFVNFDDRIYIHENPMVKEGVSLDALVDQFTTTHAAYWLPLTWFSLSLDVTLFGISAPAMKAVNVLLHLISTVLLFLWSRRVLQSPWAAGFMAAVFAFHPLHVESVAWVTERKDCLSGVFWMLALWTYTRALPTPTVKQIFKTWLWMVIGCLAKPSLLALPVLLLILDFWPGRRFVFNLTALRQNGNQLWRCLWEKWPLWVTAAGIATVVFFTQQSGGGRETAQWLTPESQLRLAFEAYGHYLHDVFIPNNLCALYPVPVEAGTWGWAVGSMIVVASVSFTVWKLRCTAPYLLAGWSWFILLMLPYVGIIHFGVQARADRWMYIPLVGVALAVVIPLQRLHKKGIWYQRTISVAAIIIIAAMAITSFKQVHYWQNTVRLFERIAAVTEHNYYAFDRLAQEYRAAGKIESAKTFYYKALLVVPRFSRSQIHLAEIYERTGDPGAGRLLRKNARHPWTAPDGHLDLGLALVRGGLYREAVPFLKRAIENTPRAQDGFSALGFAYIQLGNPSSARIMFDRAVALEPRLYSSLSHLVWLNATAETVSPDTLRQLEQMSTNAISDITSIIPPLWDGIAASAARRGDFDAAIQYIDRGLEAAEQAGLPRFVDHMKQRKKQYQNHIVPRPGTPQWK